MKLLVLKSNSVLVQAVDDDEPLTPSGKYLMMFGAIDHTHEADEYNIYTGVTDLHNDWAFDKYKYDGTTFTANPDYVVPVVEEKHVRNGMVYTTVVRPDTGKKIFVGPADEELAKELGITLGE